MDEWLVRLNGQNFWLKLEDGAKRYGFFTVRYVEAESATQAESVAVQLLRDDPTLQKALNERSDPPMIYAEEVTRDFERPSEYGNSGYTFYPEDSDG